jgi:hypothetical protein
MSHPLVSHSPDLARLVEEGYDVAIQGNNLVLRHVPYVTTARQVAYGTLISELSHNGTRTIPPATHVMWFSGSCPPCSDQGVPLNIVNEHRTMDFGGGLTAICSFSMKPQPAGKYADYYEKLVTYERLVGAPARATDPTATARTYPPHQTSAEESVFRYLDAASSRAGIGAITEKLQLPKVAIVGLGGTGAYILDLLAKTPVGEIHLFDDDFVYAHNAFRMPGAASLDDLAPMPRKVDYLQATYDPIRRAIVAHPVRVDTDTVHELTGMDFVFLAIDAGSSKRAIFDALVAADVPFIDCGMGLYRRDNSLGGIVRVTTSTPGHREHVASRVSFADPTDDEYEWNIQTGDLNMLNAAMAVLKWKKLCGYYLDRKKELNSTLTVANGLLLNGDQTP